MGEHLSTRADGSEQTDWLLWIAGGAVAAVGATWLVLAKPWSNAAAPTLAPRPTIDVTVPSTAIAATSTRDDRSEPLSPERGLDNPLHLAELAFDAGMLVEPEEYSAWTLFARVLEAEPDNADALAGLTRVADVLVRRSATAIEQGRVDDARRSVERVLTILPNHEKALALAVTLAPPAPAKLPPARTERRAARAEPPRVNPVEVASAAFEAAMAGSRLLTPSEESAKHFLEVLEAADKNHEMTRSARSRLGQEFLSRATQSLEALDGEAARIWIEEAEAIDFDSESIGTVRAALNEHLIALESAKRLPASELKPVNYVAPVYPQRALERNLQGWVDIEFTVATDGTTRDVTVIDASNDVYFRREAVAAVSQWTFEPRVYMGRLIEQRSYTRIRFVN